MTRLSVEGPLRAVVLSAAALLLASCASLPNTQSTLAGGRWVEYAVKGQGGPVVVFETGLGATMRSWEKVFPAVSELTTAFAYSRPGYGDSELTTSPRAGRVVVEELRALLEERGLEPPYVLVGHSVGGLYLQLFARLYPREVAGLVLVDSTHPIDFQGPRALQHQPWWARLALGLYMTGPRGREFRAIGETGRDVLRAPVPTGMPVIILSAGRAPAPGPETEQAPLNLRQDLARLYPGSRQQWVDSGHDIPRQRPQVVIDAIRELVETLRSGGGQYAPRSVTPE